MLTCNATYPWRPLGRIVDLFILPTLCIVGLFLNLACLFVFSRRTIGHAEGDIVADTWTSKPLSSGEQRFSDGVMSPKRKQTFQRRAHPLVPTLIVLSVCDSLQLMFSLFVLFLPALHDHMEMDPWGVVAQVAYIATGTLAGGLLASNCASIWTMCYITVQRHRAIVKPLSTVNDAKSSTKRVLPLVGIAIMAVVFNAPVWFQFSWSVYHVDGNRWFLIHQPSTLALSDDYRKVMHKILYPFAVYFGPLILISVLNMRILSYIALKRIESIGHKRRMARERRSVWLLLSIVILFFTCHTGGLIIRFVDQKTYEQSACFIFAKDFVNVLFNVNSFANPMLYFFFTKQFRDLRTNWGFTRNNSASKRLIKGVSSTKPTQTSLGSQV
uniref:G_PROTEIN_RECEP_F1_2 domain-containing protein n=1 Tax=Panagrellus redivivus TaxID=6233 RepID=A0A7E4V352_PANRE